MLKLAEFRRMLGQIDVLVASHHGRESGYCSEVFDHCRPRAVIMSDKAIVHETQGMTQTYRNHVIKHHPNGVRVSTTNKNRRVLTTRRDGWIQFEVFDNGSFNINTEYAE